MKRCWSGILLPLLLLVSPVFAQSIQPDYLYAHLDKPFYVTGEKINFKVYLLNATRSPSMIVHATLVNSEGDVLNNQLLKVKDNVTFGSVYIPLNYQEGIYYLKIYTKWNFNFDPGFNLIQKIPIYNDFGAISYDPEYDNEEQEIPSSLQDNEESMEINLLNKNPLKTRQLISLQIRIRDFSDGPLPGSLSIAVTDLDKCGASDFLNIGGRYNQLINRDHKTDTLIYPPEKEINIQGDLIEPDSGKPVNSNLISLYQLNTSKFSRLKIDKGTFSFNIAPFSGATDLQIINMNPFQSAKTKIRLRDLASQLLIPEDIALDPEKDLQINKYLYYSRIRRKIDEIFDDSHIDSLAFNEPDFLPFTPDKTLWAEKYQYLKNTEEFIREAVLNTSHIIENQKKRILLFNQETKKYFMRSPWILVDNYLILDDSLAYNIPFNQLVRIDIFNKDQSILKYFDPIMIQGGVVAIYTKNFYLSEHISALQNTVRINGLASFSSSNPDYTNSDPALKHLKPDLDPVIYWNPDIRCTQDGFAEIDFFSSDISGEYLIYITGCDQSGHPVSGSKVIKINP